MNLHISLPDGLTLGGVTTWSAEISNRLSKAGHSVSVAEHVTFNQPISIEFSPEVTWVDCTNAAHADSPFIRKKDIKKFAGWYGQNLTSTILVPNWSNGTYAACAELSKSKSAQMRVIGYVHTDEGLYYDWLHYYEPIIHQFVCVSKEIHENLVQILPHRAGDMVVKPYAVSTAEPLNRLYTNASEPIKLIYAGRISQRQKRIFDLPDLIHELEKLDVNYQFRIVGNGTEYDALESQLKKLPKEAQKKVALEPGLQPSEMADTWRSADLFISVSEYEGTSIAMLEAMGQGCVPVVTAVSGTDAVIAHAGNGLIHPIGDMVAMASTIEKLAKDRSLVEATGLQAYQTIKSRYSYDEYISWFENMTEALWQKPDRVWPKNKPVISPKLGAIKKEDIIGSMQRDPASIRILLHKILHLTRLAGPFYFTKGLLITAKKRLSITHA